VAFSVCAGVRLACTDILGLALGEPPLWLKRGRMQLR